MSPLRALIDRSGARVLIMGVLNRTPDSFSDGGAFVDEEAALARARDLLAEGADLIDVGAESTRPGSREIPAAEQIARLGQIIPAAVALGALVSVDTTSIQVARHALAQGATAVNCVDPSRAAELASLCREHGAALVIMHCRGSMTAMKGFSAAADSAYTDVVAEVASELSAAADRAIAAGLARDEILLDPGFGFAKNARHSIELLARLDEICALGFPVLAGPSRKSFLANAAAAEERDALGLPATPALAPPSQRLGGTLASVLACADRGARVVRVHDVAETRQALAVWNAVRRAPLPIARSSPSLPGEAARV
ncbi:MAG: dihydropteroate synthase [Polyangiaceae bacterium]